MAGHGAPLHSTNNNNQSRTREFVFPLNTQRINGWRNIINSFSPFGNNSGGRSLSTYARRFLTENGGTSPATLTTQNSVSQEQDSREPRIGYRSLPNSSHSISLNERSRSHRGSTVSHPVTNIDLPGTSESIVINMDNVSHSRHVRRHSHPMQIDNEHENTLGHSSVTRDSNSEPLLTTTAPEINSSDDRPESAAGESNISINGESLHEILERHPELRTFWNAIWKYIVFILILVLKVVYDGFASLCSVAFFGIAFMFCNHVVARTLSNTEPIPFMFALPVWLVLLSVPVGLFFFYQFSNKKIFYTALLLPSEGHFMLSLGELLWIVIMTDLFLKLVTVFIKGIYVIIPKCILRNRQKGNHLALVEYTSQLYRSLAPVQPWICYLLENYTGIEKVYGVFLSALYMLCKGPDILLRVKNFIRVFWMFCQSSSYGVTPSVSQLKDSGVTCPICQDNYTHPIRLQCEHIFCESCVARWFNRERTCPMCRTKIADDPSYKDGSTTFALQLF